MEPVEEMEEGEEQIISTYQDQLSQLLDCLRLISTDWQTHYDQLQMNSNRLHSDTSYQLAFIRTGRCCVVYKNTALTIRSLLLGILYPHFQHILHTK